MNDILAVATSWWSLPLAMLISGISLGFMPGFLLRQIVRLYPKEDERRTELFAELRALPYLRRILWVFEQFETGIVDGRRARRAPNARHFGAYHKWALRLFDQVPGDFDDRFGCFGYPTTMADGTLIYVIHRADNQRVIQARIPNRFLVLAATQIAGRERLQ